MSRTDTPTQQPAKTERRRDYAMDLLRIFSCFGIVILHESGFLAVPPPGGDDWLVSWSVYQSFIRPCLWVFALLSGYFILSKPIRDMKDFYLRKASAIVIPLIVYSLVYQLWNGRHSFDSIGTFFSIFSFKAILTDSVSEHLWFVYVLIGIYLVAPFLQKMVEALDDRQLIGLIFLIFLSTAGPDYLQMAGVKLDLAIPMSGVLFFYFMLGYALTRFDLTRYAKVIMVLGVINLPLTAFMLNRGILAANLCTSSVNMLVGTLFYYSLARQLPSLKRKGLQKATVSLSRKTYSIYLIHILILNQLASRSLLPLTAANHLYMPLLASISIFVLSYLASLLIDSLAVKPLMKLWNATFVHQ